MFRTREDFIHGMNSVAICSQRENVAIIAFCLMDNHVHFVVNGYEDNCRLFMTCFLKRHSEWLGRQYGGHKVLARVGKQVKAIDTVSYLSTVISYVHRNPLVAGICAPTNYEWSSASYFFSGKSVPSSWHRLGNVGINKLRGMLHTRITDLPKNMLLNEENMIVPRSYLRVKFVERLYGTPVNYMYEMNKNSDVEVEMTLTRGRKMFDDKKLVDEIPRICMAEFGTSSFESLSSADKCRLASILHRRYGASVNQVARLTGMTRDFLSQILSLTVAR